MAIDLYNLVLTAKIQKGGGGPSVEVEPLSVTENGTYSASSGYAFDPVEVSVPTGVFPSGTSSITSNGIYDITNFASVDVNVSGGGGGHDAEDDIIDRAISGIYSNDRVTRIGNYAFTNCSNLTSINFPNVGIVGERAFFGCSNIEAAILPSVSSLESYAFGTCYKLSSVNMPDVETIGVYGFNACSKLSTASFPKLKTISSSAFMGCNLLMSLYLLSSSAIILGSNAFRNTPMLDSSYTGSFGSVFVPASLVDTYKSKNGWRTFSDRITAYQG